MNVKNTTGYGAAEWIFAVVVGIGIFVLVKACGGSPDAQQIPHQTTAAQEWYAGGTLQNATLAEWQRGTYRNRLASSADFAGVVANNAGSEIESIDDLRPMATAIERCISDTGADPSAGATQVSDVAAACAILMQQ